MLSAPKSTTVYAAGQLRCQEEDVVSKTPDEDASGRDKAGQAACLSSLCEGLRESVARLTCPCC